MNSRAQKISELLDVSPVFVKLACNIPFDSVYVYSIEDALKKYTESDDEEKKYAIMQKWLLMCKTHEQANAAYLEAENSEEQNLAIDARMRLATEFDDLSDLLDEDIDSQKLFRKLVQTFCSFNLTPNQAEQIYDSTDDDSEEESMVITAWIEACINHKDSSTIDEQFDLSDFFETLEEELDEDDRDEYFIKKKIIDRFEEAVSAAMNNNPDFEGLIGVLELVFPGSPSEKKVLLKLVELCKKEEHFIAVKTAAEELYEDGDVDQEDDYDEVLAALVKKAYNTL